MEDFHMIKYYTGFTENNPEPKYVEIDVVIRWIMNEIFKESD